MGFFSRNRRDNQDSDHMLGKVELPRREDINEAYIEQSQGGVYLDSGGHRALLPHSSARTVTYSVEDAIELMSSLPQDNIELVVTVVKKTLESAHVNVRDIITAADQKQYRLQRQQEKLEREIKQLEAKIQERKLRIDSLKLELEETLQIREQLQLSVELEQRQLRADLPKANEESSEDDSTFQESATLETAETDSASDLESSDNDETRSAGGNSETEPEYWSPVREPAEHDETAADTNTKSGKASGSLTH